MKKGVLLIFSLVVAILFLILSMVNRSKVIILDDPEAIFTQALRSLSKSCHMTITKETITTIDQNTYSETVHIEQSYNLENNNAAISQTSVFEQEIKTKETYINGTIYLEIDETGFSKTISPTEAKKRYMPPNIITTSLYQTISGTKSRNSIKICFSDARIHESWAAPDDITLIDCNATAYLNRNGQLESVQYFLRYLKDHADIQIHYTITVQEDKTRIISAPENPENFIPISDIDAPIILKRLSGFLIRQETIYTSIKESVDFPSFGDQRITSCIAEAKKTDSPFISIITETTLKNSSQPTPNKSTVSVKEVFDTDTYIVSLNDSPPTSDPSITLESFVSKYEGILLSALVPISYIQDATITETDTYYIITYTAKEDLGQYITETLSDAMYQDATTLTGNATDHTLQELSCEISISKEHYFPTRIATVYAGFYSIGEIQHPISYTLTQTFAK